jgi:hypothetical protein
MRENSHKITVTNRKESKARITRTRKEQKKRSNYKATRKLRETFRENNSWIFVVFTNSLINKI